ITTSPNGVILTWSNDTCTIIPTVHLRWLVLLENLGWIVNEAGHYTTTPVGDQVIANFAPLAAIHNLVWPLGLAKLTWARLFDHLHNN
ncbi:hypothetical protein OF390_08530, partial [Limosilactobacillus fermentum]